MFSGSSRFKKIASSDGTHAVFCWKCGEAISFTVNSITRAICAKCEYLEATGQPLSEEANKAYQFSKANLVDVSLLVVQEEAKIYASLPTKFTLRSMGGNLLQAMGFKKKERPVKAKKTLQIVEQKERRSLFSNVQELGMGINELDQKLTDENKL